MTNLVEEFALATDGISPLVIERFRWKLDPRNRRIWVEGQRDRKDLVDPCLVVAESKAHPIPQ